jgi:endoglucanase Acf2
MHCTLLTFLMMAAPGVVPLGAGSYLTAPPPGGKTPPATIYRTEDCKGPVPTNTWYGSQLWAPFSEPMFADPLVLRSEPRGLRVAYPGVAINVSRNAIMAGMPGGSRDLVLGLAGARFTESRLAGHSDWFATTAFVDGPRHLTVSYGHGSPFVYALVEGADPQVTFAAPPKVWLGDARTPILGVTEGGKDWMLIGPSGATWDGLGEAKLTCRCGGKPYFAVALLPDHEFATVDMFRLYAYSHVVDTQVSWAYDEARARVTTHFKFITKAWEGATPGTVFAVYPHQFLGSGVPQTLQGYKSVRGAMPLLPGEEYVTHCTLPGILPALPTPGTADPARLKTLIEAEAAHGLGDIKDTYWEGKALGRLASLLPIAQQVGAVEAERKLRDALRARLESWLTADDGKGGVKTKGVFAYDRNWGTLIGYPAGYGSDTEINDHHFHYGYFLRAAAEMARKDPSWAGEQRYGPMLRMLARDIAAPDRADPLFPRLRHLDPYAGHSWASGSGRFGDGNNEESSSEAMNAWTGIFLLGQYTGDKALRDLGAYLYATELAGINAYWFDVTGQIRPPGYQASVVTMVWGGKSVNETWFSAVPECVHGINWLPFQGGSLYLGLYPDYCARNYAALVKEKGGPGWTDWADLVLMYRALSDPADALAQLRAAGDKIGLEAGDSRPFLEHWLGALDELGQVDRTVSGDYPLSLAFVKNGRRTYAGYNAEREPRTINFSDGGTLRLEPGAFGVRGHE